MSSRVTMKQAHAWERQVCILWLSVLAACSAPVDAGTSWVVEENGAASDSLYSFPSGTSIRLETDALVLSYRAAERRIPARVTRHGQGAVIELERGGRIVLQKARDGQMELVREGVYRLKLKEGSAS
ncbi:MAG TPA: hypothetical protein VI197_20535 [Polyangiaceae bacterium]